MTSSIALSLHVAHGSELCEPLLEYDLISSTVTQRFYDKSFRGLDWDSRVAEHRSEIDCRDDAERVALIANKLLSELKASHTAVYTAMDFHYWGLRSFFSKDVSEDRVDFSGIWPERTNGKWFAKYVLEASPAARAGILPGDELISINGERFHPFGFSDGRALLAVSSDGVTRRVTTLRSVKQSVMEGLVRASAASSKILKVGGHRVGYFHLWAARDAILQSLDLSLKTFERKKVDALIVDFRGGYGGTSAEYLKKIQENGYFEALPKYFLVDDGVRSGKEMLAAMIKKDKTGTLVGSKTAGAFLGAVPVRLANDKYFVLVAAYGGDIPEVGPIEGIGVSPDVVVLPCREYCGKRDEQLESALQLVRRLAKKNWN